MLNLDEYVKSIKTHQITLGGIEYTAKPLTLKQLLDIQRVYNEAEEDSLEPVKLLFNTVGYPAEELLQLPLEAIMQVQTELFLSIQEQAQKLEKNAKKN